MVSYQTVDIVVVRSSTSSMMISKAQRIATDPNSLYTRMTKPYGLSVPTGKNFLDDKLDL